MGTFLVKFDPSTIVTPNFTPHSSNGAWQPWRVAGIYDQCGPAFTVPSNERWWHIGDLLSGGCSFSEIGNACTISLSNFNTANIYIDGDPIAYSINTLPISGFLITGFNSVLGSIRFVSGLDYFNDTGSVVSNTVIFNISGPCSSFTVNGGNGFPSLRNINGYKTGPLSTTLPSPTLYSAFGLNAFSGTITLNKLISSSNEHYIRFVYDGTPTLPYSGNLFTNLNGDYTIWSSQLSITPQEDFTDPLIITDGANGLDAITSFNIYFYSSGILTVSVANVISQAAGVVTLSIPSDVIPDTGTAISVGGIIDEGEVLLGSLEILYADASGIYTLVPGRKRDVLYDRDNEDVIDVKIPDPMIKTGFIP